MNVNDKSITAAAAALAAHASVLGINGDANMQLSRMIASLREWAAANGVTLPVQQTICLPSDANEDCPRHIYDRNSDRHVVLPIGTDSQEAIQAINKITHAVNLDAEENGGSCLNGESREENVKRGITALGFVFLEKLETTKPWDTYDVMVELHKDDAKYERG